MGGTKGELLAWEAQKGSFWHGRRTCEVEGRQLGAAGAGGRRLVLTLVLVLEQAGTQAAAPPHPQAAAAATTGMSTPLGPHPAPHHTRPHHHVGALPPPMAAHSQQLTLPCCYWTTLVTEKKWGMGAALELAVNTWRPGVAAEAGASDVHLGGTAPPAQPCIASTRAGCASCLTKHAECGWATGLHHRENNRKSGRSSRWRIRGANRQKKHLQHSPVQQAHAEARKTTNAPR
eukprot:1161538-Pelagomonas_calceolata.AAC.6